MRQRLTCGSPRRSRCVSKHSDRSTADGQTARRVAGERPVTRQGGPGRRIRTRHADPSPPPLFLARTGGFGGAYPRSRYPPDATRPRRKRRPCSAYPHEKRALLARKGRFPCENPVSLRWSRPHRSAGELARLPSLGFPEMSVIVQILRGGRMQPHYCPTETATASEGGFFRAIARGTGLRRRSIESAGRFAASSPKASVSNNGVR